MDVETYESRTATKEGGSESKFLFVAQMDFHSDSDPVELSAAKIDANLFSTHAERMILRQVILIIKQVHLYCKVNTVEKARNKSYRRFL